MLHKASWRVDKKSLFSPLKSESSKIGVSLFCFWLKLNSPWDLHLNTNAATGNFGIYKIEINNKLHKIGKADLGRVTKSSGLPTRLHQQLRKLRKIYGKGNVVGEVIKKGFKTTASAKAAETKKLQDMYNKTGAVPEGNKKSFKPNPCPK